MRASSSSTGPLRPGAHVNVSLGLEILIRGSERAGRRAKNWRSSSRITEPRLFWTAWSRSRIRLCVRKRFGMPSDVLPPRAHGRTGSGGRLRRHGLRDCFVGLSAFCIPLTPQSGSRGADQEGGNQQRHKI